MRILLFTFALLELTAAVALFWLASALNDPQASPPTRQWLFWVGWTTASAASGVPFAFARVFTQQKWPGVVGMFVYGATFLLAFPLGWTGLGLVAEASAEGGEWAALGMIVACAVGVGSAVIMGFLSIVTLILLAAVHANTRRSNVPVRP